MSKFNKPALTINQQVDFLSKQGLLIDNREKAAKFLKNVGYFRFFSYAQSFIQNNKQFRPSVRFSDISDLYTLDRKLRILVLDAIERIEVSLKARIVDTLSLKYHNPHWYLEKNIFNEGKYFQYNEFIKSLENQNKLNHSNHLSKEDFISKYQNQYSDPKSPPSWMIMQNLSFGTMSIMYSHLNLVDKKLLAKDFGVSHKILSSWVQCISYMRNLCAHHARIFNRNFTKTPIAKNGLENHFIQSKRLYAQLFIIFFLLEQISDHYLEWKNNLLDILKELNDYESNIGMPDDSITNYFQIE